MREIKCIVPAGDKCGEAATWSASENALYWCDINRFLVHRFDEKTLATHHWFFEEPVVAIALTNEPGRMLLALASKLIWWWPESDKRIDHGFKLDGFPKVRFNDGRPDPYGNFWVGSMKNNVNADGSSSDVEKGKGMLYRITPKGDVTIWRKGLGISNTLCFSPDHRYFYFGDTLENTIYRYDYDNLTHEISNEAPYFRGFERGFPDGSSIDCEGYLWNCRYDGGCVVRVAPNGESDQIINMPVTNITTCTFGGEDLSTLYITTAADPRERLSGGLFSIRVAVKGLPENRVLVGQ